MIEWAEIRMEDAPRVSKLPDVVVADDKAATVLKKPTISV